MKLITCKFYDVQKKDDAIHLYLNYINIIGSNL